MADFIFGNISDYNKKEEDRNKAKYYELQKIRKNKFPFEKSI